MKNYGAQTAEFKKRLEAGTKLDDLLLSLLYVKRTVVSWGSSHTASKSKVDCQRWRYVAEMSGKGKL